jgi:O-glycosyl hydrolase
LKTFDTLIAYSEKNTLLPTEAAYTTYARYFANVLKAYRREGLTIQYFTLQNEPLFGTSDQYPGMYFTSEQAVKLGQFHPRSDRPATDQTLTVLRVRQVIWCTHFSVQRCSS